MRWCDSLEEGSIHSFEELTRAFGARFVTCNRVPRPLDSLLSMSIREGETLKSYSNRYWEIYNEIDEDFKDFTVQTFKVGLPTHSNLWKSLTMKLPRSMHQLMDQIQEHKRVEDSQISSKGKAKVFTNDRRDSSLGWFAPFQPRREYSNQATHNFNGSQAIDSDRGHTIEDCKTLQAFRDQLIKAGKLKQFLQQPDSHGGQPTAGLQRSGAPQSSLGMINFFFATPRRDPSSVSGVLLMSPQMEGLEEKAPCKKAKILEQPVIGFSKEDKMGMIQPHDDALVVTL
ncbi:uncharacterized protein LOC142612428 [Castanea sativa]|uniref:uncharacterized protein LOC142612428 n=1 Tax=Castanea sativa TaxID=21020 RepID=UPI003F652707